MTEPSTTLNGILNQRVMLEQPAEGYRVAIDTVLLAAAVPALTGDAVLDLGCGVGGAMLCVACRVPGLRGTGIDIQQDLVDLCVRNIARNGFASGLSARRADATALPEDLNGLFDHAMMNPPYHDEACHDVSSNEVKRTANAAKSGDLPLWIASARAALKPSGTLTIIHRADKRGDILSCLEKGFGNVAVFSPQPRSGMPSKRIIIAARKDAPFVVHDDIPFVLHTDTGSYTEEAESIFRHCERLVLDVG
ncbi:MAG: methyltransferase [Alphaproteobacteria bacterium]|nr:methyltransferase [Alphaproteobacteria bacterium]